MEIFNMLLFIAISTSLSISIQTQNNQGDEMPNFVILLVDDLGIGDIGCFGNHTIRTPNIDQIAKEGVKLEHNLSPESVCTPSRGAFLTGRYPIRLGLANGPESRRVLVFNAVQGGLPANETTFAKILQARGYKTGFIGKWHLGISHDYNDFIHHPLNHGFDFFYGLPFTNMRDCGIGMGSSISNLVPEVVKFLSGIGFTLSFAMLIITAFIKVHFSFWLRIFLLLFCVCCVLVLAIPNFVSLFNCLLMRNFDVVEQSLYLKDLTHRFTTDAVHFINANKDQPFLLFMSFVKVHTALFTTDAFTNRSKHGKYGDNVEEMDWAVGQIVKAIRDNNLRKRTLVYFTSDHGPQLEEVIETTAEYHGGWRGQYKGGKGMSWEGGIRVPTVAMWPGMIPPETTVTEPTGSIDIFRTIIELANASVPQDRIIDSKNIFPLLQGNNVISPHEFIYHYCGSSLQAVTYRPRVGNQVWKAHFATPKWTPGTTACFEQGLCGCHGNVVNIHNPPLLFSLTDDSGEIQPLEPNLPEYQNLINVIIKAAKKHRNSIEKVPDQMVLNNWLPWLQVCCNTPFCHCREKYPHQLLHIKN